MFGTTTLGVTVTISSNGVHRVDIRDTAGTGASVSLPNANYFVPGQINTVAFVWNGDRNDIYTNGEYAGSLDMSTSDVNFGANSSALKIGDSGYQVFPIVILSTRIDEGAWTATEVMNNHISLTDPVALQFAMNQRGRVYQITAIPQTLRSSSGGSHVLGQLKLEQVDFQHWLADPLNVEEVKR
jgi:hypothetical protein